jgi:EAL domain-containing protein (putative c-di-GMP-specific phosphodiesterase class I)
MPAEHYWIMLQCADNAVATRMKSDLEAKGLTNPYDTPLIFGRQITHPWVEGFKEVAEVVKKHSAAPVVKMAVIPAEPRPIKEEVELTLRSYIEIEQVSKHIWLMYALIENRLICFMQRVMDKRGKVSGYEAFARIEDMDGSIRDGGAIILASRMLNVEFQLDRMLHKEAVSTFIESDSDGYLFINFLTGFIHRPERYLEGLSQGVEHYGLMPRHIVLDISIQPPLAALKQLLPTVQYCRTRGFSIAVDDVMNPDDLRTVLHEIKPDFVKLDGRISRGAMETRYANLISEMVRLTHESGAMVVAEGVEADEQHKKLTELGVDLFQGYLFGAPERMQIS